MSFWKKNVKTLSDHPSFYEDAQAYWNQIDASPHGMMGGLENLSPIDLTASTHIVFPFISEMRKKSTSLTVCDCGAGIGRITKCLLAGLFDHIDMVEPCAKFLDKADKYLGAEGAKVDKKICSGLQDFYPEDQRYHVIWCQWVLCYLPDEDLINFLKRCAKALKPGGFIFAKENVCTRSNTEFDQLDSSICRPESLFKSIFAAAGVTIVKQDTQKDFPLSLYPVLMFVLQPNQKN